MGKEFKNCPFCGALAHKISDNLVGCSEPGKCPTRGFLMSPEAWNRRAMLPEVKALVDAAVGALEDLSSPKIRAMCTCDHDVGWICHICSYESDLRTALKALNATL